MLSPDSRTPCSSRGYTDRVQNPSSKHVLGMGLLLHLRNGAKQPLAAARAGAGGTAAGLDGKGDNWEGSSQRPSADAAGAFTGAEAWQQQQQQQ